MAGVAGKELQNQLQKACEGINTHPKFKSAYYFSLQPLETLCDPSTGRCSQNALYALTHGCVPKILIGLQQFAEDERTSMACMKIFEVMCDAANPEELQQFFDQGGVQGVLNWAAEANAKNSQEAFEKALKILVALAKFEVTAAVPILITKLKTQDDITVSQTIADAIIKIAENYAGCQIEGLPGLISYLIHLSEQVATTRAFTQLVDLTFQSLRAVAAKSQDAGEYILQLLELKDRYADDAVIEIYLMPLLKTICSREEAISALETLKTAPDTPGLSLKLYRAAYCPELTDIVREMEASSYLINTIRERTSSLVTKPLPEDQVQLICSCCSVLSSLDSGGVEELESLKTFDMLLKLLDAAGQYPNIISSGNELISLFLTKESTALRYIREKILSTALSRLNNVSEKYSSRMLLSMCSILRNLSNNSSCCKFFKELKVIPQITSSLRESTYNSAITFLLVALRNYVLRCDPGEVDDSNLLLLIECCLGQRHISEHIISETANLIEALSSGSYDSNLSAKLIFRCLDCVPSIDSMCFADCVAALRSIRQIDRYVDETANACITISQKVASKYQEARFPFVRLGALCSVDPSFSKRVVVQKLSSKLPECIDEITRSSKIDSASREALVTTLVYLVQAINDPIESLEMMYSIAIKINSSQDPDALARVIQLIKGRVGYFNPNAKDERNLPTTQLLNGFLNTEIILKLVKLTQKLLQQHGDSRPGSIESLALLDSIMLLNQPEGSVIALSQNLQNEVINIGKRLKMFSEVQMAVFITLENMLKYASEEQLKVTKEMGIVQIVKSAEANHCRNKALRKQIFKVSVLVMQSNYLEEVIKTLIQKCEADLTLASTKNSDEFSEVGEDYDQLIFPLNDPEGIRIALRLKIINTMERTLKAMDDPKLRLAAQACVTPFTQLLQLLGKSTNVATAMIAHEFATKLTVIASHLMASNPQSSSIHALLTTAGSIMNHDSSEADRCLGSAPAIMAWLAANDYAQICYETIAAWLSRMPVVTLLDSGDFKTIIAALVKATESEDVAVVTSALRAIRQFDQSELFPVLRDMGIERATYYTLHRMGSKSSFVLNESLAILDRFSAELAQELSERSTVIRARVLARILAIATSDVSIIRAFDILGRLVVSCPDKNWFRGETSLIKSVRWVQAKLGSRTSEVEDAMNSILAVMGGEEMALMLMSQLLDLINKAKADRAHLASSIDRLGSEFTDIAPYLSGVFDKPQRLFQGLGECFDAVKPILKDFPSAHELREGVYSCAIKALDSAQLLKNDNESIKMIGDLIQANLGPDLTQVLTSGNIGLNGTRLIARMCGCSYTSAWAMSALKSGNLINYCFRNLKSQPSDEEVRKALEFMAALGAPIEGFHMLQRSFKTLYGSNSDFWRQQSEAVMSYGKSANYALPHLFNFPGNCENCAEQVVSSLAPMVKLGSSSIVASMWSTAICVKASNFVSPEQLKKNIGNILTFCNGNFGELEKVMELQNMTPQEMTEVLEPLSKIVSFTANASELDEINDKAVSALSRVLRSVEMRSQLWKTILPSLIESVTNSKFCAERIVRCLYPIIQEHIRYFKGAQSVIRDDGLRLVAACSMYIPIPDHQEFLKNLGRENEAENEIVKGLELIRSELFRERNTGVMMNTSNSEILQKHIADLRQTLEQRSTLPVNPDDPAASDLLTALECISLLRDETLEDFSKIFQTLLTNQSNPVILSSVIRTLSDLKMKSPKTISRVFSSMEPNSLIRVVSELVKGMDACSSDEKIERLILFTNQVPSSIFESTPLYSCCLNIFNNQNSARERRYALIAMTRVLEAKPKANLEISQKTAPVIISAIQDPKLRQQGADLYDSALQANLPDLENILQGMPEWKSLLSDPDLMPLLLRTPESRNAILQGQSDDRLKQLVDNIPATASVLIDLCESDPRFILKLRELCKAKAGSQSLEQFYLPLIHQGGGAGHSDDGGLGGGGELLLLLTYIGDREALERPIDEAFKTLASGKGDYYMLQVCCRTLTTTERGRWLIQTFDSPMWSKHRMEILTALISNPQLPAAMNKEAVQKCRRDSLCQKVILDKAPSTVLDPPLLCEMLCATSDPDLIRRILDQLRQCDWSKESIAPNLIRLFQRNLEPEVCENLLTDLLEKLRMYHNTPPQAILTTGETADWGDEPVPSEGFLPLSYAIKRPVHRRAWQILDLNDAQCHSLVSNLLKYLSKKSSLDLLILDTLAYFACEKPVGLESIWYINDFFGKSQTLLKTRPISESAVLAISTAACNIAAVSDETGFAQLKMNKSFWHNLELAMDNSASGSRDWKALVTPVLNLAHDDKSTQLDFLRKSRFNWFEISMNQP